MYRRQDLIPDAHVRMVLVVKADVSADDAACPAYVAEQSCYVDTLQISCLTLAVLILFCMGGICSLSIGLTERFLFYKIVKRIHICRFIQKML